MAIGVATSAELEAAIAAAVGGEEIRVAPGDYGIAVTKPPRPYDAPVTITAGDPASPPVFTEPWTPRAFQNLHLRGLQFRSNGNLVAFAPRLRFYGGTLLSVTGCRFVGEKDAAGHYGYGIMGTGITDIEIVKNELTVLRRGIAFSNTRRLKVSKNDLHDIGHDGMSFAALFDSEITENLIEDFYPLGGYHPDAIQFHSNGQPASEDILIGENCIVTIPPRRIQGIFMRGQYPSDPTQRYQRVHIRANLVIGSTYHGITAGQGDDLMLETNGVHHIPADGDPVYARVSAPDSNGVARNNKAFRFLFPPTGITEEGNTAVPAITVEEATRLRAEWIAKFRPPSLKSELLAYLDKSDVELRSAMDAITRVLAANGAARRAVEGAPG